MLPTPLIRLLIALGDFHRRLLPVWFAFLGPDRAYAVTALLARALYHLAPGLRPRCEAHAAAALAGRVPAGAIPRLAARSWVHRAWSLTDLLLAERHLLPNKFRQYGLTVPEPQHAEILAAQSRGQPILLLTAYYGPYDLLPLILGLNGIRAAALYRPHANAAYDAYRRRVRGRSGAELILVEEALPRLPQILERGGTIALVADHAATRHGVPAHFLGLPTLVPRTVGILAARHNAHVIVAGVRRVRRRFAFDLVVTDVFRPDAWAAESDSVAYITHRYLRALEALILTDPEQYTWAYARWGEDLARRMTGP